MVIRYIGQEAGLKPYSPILSVTQKANACS